VGAFMPQHGGKRTTKGRKAPPSGAHRLSVTQKRLLEQAAADAVESVPAPGPIGSGSWRAPCSCQILDRVALEGAPAAIPAAPGGPPPAKECCMRMRRPVAVVLLVGAAIAAAPSSLSASPSSLWRQEMPVLGALDQAWQLLSHLLGGASTPAVRPKNGASPDPNGGAPAPNGGASPDPNGGAALLSHQIPAS
jgi:hypothetical protein